MMTAAGWIVAVDKLIETGQIQITNCDANFAVGTNRSTAQFTTIAATSSFLMTVFNFNFPLKSIYSCGSRK